MANIDIKDAVGATKTVRTRVDAASANVEGVDVFPGVYTATGDCINLTVSTVVKTNGSGYTLPAGTTHVLVSVEGAGGDVRFTEHGEAATAGHGSLLPAGASIELALATTLQFIRAASLDALVSLLPRAY